MGAGDYLIDLLLSVMLITGVYQPTSGAVTWAAADTRSPTRCAVSLR